MRGWVRVRVKGRVRVHDSAQAGDSVAMVRETAGDGRRWQGQVREMQWLCNGDVMVRACNGNGQ